MEQNKQKEVLQEKKDVYLVECTYLGEKTVKELVKELILELYKP